MAAAVCGSDVSVSSPPVSYGHPKRFIKIFVQRDYSQGTDVKFQTKFPPEFEGIIDRKTYEQCISDLNRIYLEAEKINGSAFWEGCLACLTSYLIYACIETRYQRCLKRAAAYIEEQNESVFGPRGMNIRDPIERGLREMLLAEGITPFLTADIIKRCKEVGIRTVLDFLSLETEILCQKISVSYKDISSIQRILLACYASFPQSGDSVYEDQLQSLSILNTGSQRLDEFLEGGIYTGEITEIHGLPSSGKTQLCFSVLSCLLLETENTAIYLDTNGSFTSKRLQQILLTKSRNEQVVADCLKRVKIIIVYDIYHLFDILHHIKSQLCKEENSFFLNLKLIVLDSVAPVVSPSLCSLKFEGQGLMNCLAQQLKLLCYEHVLSVLVSNNMVLGENSCVKPALGRYWKHVPSVTLSISKSDKKASKSSRVLTIQKSCRKGTYGNIRFNITDRGISDVSEVR